MAATLSTLYVGAIWSDGTQIIPLTKLYNAEIVDFSLVFFRINNLYILLKLNTIMFCYGFNINILWISKRRRGNKMKLWA